MRHTLKSAVLAVAAVAAFASMGCQDRVQSVRVVDQSVLPTSAKSMFGQEAQITKVEELTYSKRTPVYRITYTAEGKSKQIMYNAKDETTPTGVFEHAAH